MNYEGLQHKFLTEADNWQSLLKLVTRM